MTSHGAPENDDCYGASARQKSSSSARSGPLMTSGNPVFWSKTPALAGRDCLGARMSAWRTCR